jgi:hypothetical protein
VRIGTRCVGPDVMNTAGIPFTGLWRAARNWFSVSAAEVSAFFAIGFDGV